MATTTSTCAVCHGEGKFKCSKCKSIAYCGADCQKKHWAKHKLVCGKFNSLNSSSNIFIDHLQLEEVHTGKALEGVIVDDPICINGIHFELEDAKGSRIMVVMYNFPGYENSNEVIGEPIRQEAVPKQLGFQKGKLVSISEPFYKTAKNGEMIIRVDNFDKVRLLQ